MQQIKNILYSSHFKRSLKKIPLKLISIVEKREILFRKNCFDHKLRTHKLKGKKPALWSFSVTSSHRVLFQFIDNETVLFMEIGDHSIYK